MKKILSIITLLTLFCASVGAQTLKSMYFTERNPYRHEINASLAPENGYVTVPLFGNIAFGTQSNLEISSFVEPTEDGTMNLFMSRNFDADKFVESLYDNTNLDLRYNMDIVNFGFYTAKSSFVSFSARTKLASTTNLPSDFFKFLKLGMANEGDNLYDFSGLSTSNSLVAEIALGYSQDIEAVPGLRVGGKVKALLGLFQFDAYYDNFTANLSQDQWLFKNEGTLAVAGFQPSIGQQGSVDMAMEELELGLNGFGMAFDLGASYRLLDDKLEVSFGVNDLGFMNWKNGHVYQACDSMKFEGFSDIDLTGDSESSTSMDDQVSDLTTDVMEMFNFYENKMGSTSPRKSMNTNLTTINAGATYDFFDNRISVGVLWTAQLNSLYTWHDVMASVNLRPCRGIDLGFNGSLSNMGNTFGALLNLSAKRFTFFLGAQAMSLKVAAGALPIPINGLTYQANIGFSGLLAGNKKGN